MSQGSFKAVSIKFQGCVESVARKFIASLNGVSIVSMVFQDILRLLQGWFKCVTKLFEEYFSGF